MATLAAKTVLKENTKLPSDDQGETLPFVFLVLDCGFVVALKNTAWFAKIEIFPLSEYFILRKQKLRVQEQSCKLEFGCVREAAICLQHTGGSE